jgi:site-specific DNA-methyltransferase (adenine-specific)
MILFNDLTLLKGDCLELMKGIPDESVDLVLTDPPYGTTACKWDSVIPFEPMWEQLNRIIKPNGAICLFGSEPFSSALRMSNIKNFKYDWIWDKKKAGNIFLAKYQPVKVHENIIVFGKGKVNYYPIMIERDKIKKSKNYGTGETMGGNREKEEKVYSYTHKNPISILQFSNASQKGKVHPTQKPIALLEYLTKTYTNEGETVLDFTMGSGSTGVACVNAGRKFIGIELDENYFNIAVKRIAEAQKAVAVHGC